MSGRRVRCAGRRQGKLVNYFSNYFLKIAAAAAIVFGCAASVSAAPVLMLDSGHNPEKPGARSWRGIDEMVYNDRFVAELAPALQSDGWDVRLTRLPGESVSLSARADAATQAQARLFLSIHHDSAQLIYLREVETPTGKTYQSVRPITGYSIFVSGLNPRFDDSFCAARFLGRELLSLGRAPNLLHAEPPDRGGENRPLLNKKFGIYRFDHLAVLRRAAVPAVLLEIGVIVDAADEAYVDDMAKRSAMIAAIIRAVRPFRDRVTCPE